MAASRPTATPHIRQSASNVCCGELMSGASGASFFFGGVSDGFAVVPTFAFHSAAPSEAAFLMRAAGAAERGRAVAERGGGSSGCHAAASSASANGIAAGVGARRARRIQNPGLKKRRVGAREETCSRAEFGLQVDETNAWRKRPNLPSLEPCVGVPSARPTLHCP
eukprot:scaffold43393_cov60-Phaeocystis_antarctica.AAC.3